MPSDLEPGRQLTIVQRSDPPAQWVADIVALRDDSIALRVADGSIPWNPSATYILICGASGSRRIAPATYFAHKNTAVAFKLKGAWKPLDFRKDRRFHVEMTVEVRSVLGSSRQPGRLVDISMGGLAVDVETRPGGNQVEVRLWAGGYSAQVVCDVVRGSELDGRTVLHLRFHELTPPQSAFIRQLIATLMTEEGQQQAS